MPQLLAMVVLAAPAPALETRFLQIAPVVRESPALLRSAGQRRAVVLIHGLYLHPLKKDWAAGVVLHSWQKPGCLLANKLVAHADVFAFAYAQRAPVDDVADSAGLAAAVQQLRQLGYPEIVLVGHSAGGLIARQFVEDHPDAGVTKVIQVATPNAGSGWAVLSPQILPQADFLASLRKSARRRALRDRAGRIIPSHVEFACVVGTIAIKGDVFVQLESQWSPDLQHQGIPAYPVAAIHWHLMKNAKSAELLADLVRTRQPRWSHDLVERTRKNLWKGARAAAPAS